MSYPEIFILRHGQTEWNKEGRMQGHLDSPLTETGRQQAAQQRDLLAKTELPEGVSFWVSPQPRARSTAEIALDGLCQAPNVDPRLREIHMGTWDGLTGTDIDAEAPGVRDLGLMSWMDHAPGGEHLSGLRQRVEDWLSELRSPAVVVTHGITSRMMRGIVLGLSIPDMEALPGGQGIIYRVKDGVHELIA